MLPQTRRWTLLQCGGAPEGRRASATRPCIQLPQGSGPWWKMKLVCQSQANVLHACHPLRERPPLGRVSGATLRLVGPKGTSLLCGCKWLLPPFPQGSHLVDGFFSTSCCLVPGSQLVRMGRESFFLLCSSLPGWLSETRKGGSSSEQPRGHCLLTWFKSASMGQGPPPDSRDLFPYLF